MIFFSDKNRPFELGPYPMERLKRDESVGVEERSKPKIAPDAQKMAYYHANMMPPPNQPEPVTVNRKEALAAGALLEPNEIIARLDEGGETPAHYRPTKPIGHEDFKRMKTDEGLNPSKSS